MLVQNRVMGYALNEQNKNSSLKNGEFFTPQNKKLIEIYNHEGLYDKLVVRIGKTHKNTNR